MTRLPDLVKLNRQQAADAGYSTGIGFQRSDIIPLEPRLIGHYMLPPGSLFLTDLTVPYGQLRGFVANDHLSGSRVMMIAGAAYSDLTWGMFLEDQLAAAVAEAVQIVRDGLADITAWSQRVLGDLDQAVDQS